jgi:hypothetical protein
MKSTFNAKIGLFTIILVAYCSHQSSSLAQTSTNSVQRQADTMERERLAQEKRDLQRNSNPNVVTAQPTPPPPSSKEPPVLKKEKKKKPDHFVAEVPGSKPEKKPKKPKKKEAKPD